MCIKKIGHDSFRLKKRLAYYDRSYYINIIYYNILGSILKSLIEFSEWSIFCNFLFFMDDCFHQNYWNCQFLRYSLVVKFDFSLTSSTVIFTFTSLGIKNFNIKLKSMISFTPRIENESLLTNMNMMKVIIFILRILVLLIFISKEKIIMRY